MLREHLSSVPWGPDKDKLLHTFVLGSIKWSDPIIRKYYDYYFYHYFVSPSGDRATILLPSQYPETVTV